MNMDGSDILIGLEREEESVCDILLIIDSSGSMMDLRSDAIGGINSFIEEQKKLPGRAFLTMVTFSSTWEVVRERTNIQTVEPMTAESYVPNGMTAMWDAIGGALDYLNGAVDESEVQPQGKVIAIFTDGEENSSREYTMDRVKDMLEQEKGSGAMIQYLAAAEDALQRERMTHMAIDLGIGPDMVETFHHTGQGVTGVAQFLTTSTTSYRTQMYTNTTGNPNPLNTLMPKHTGEWEG